MVDESVLAESAKKSEESDKIKTSTENTKDAKKEDIPIRPRKLRGELLCQYNILAVALLIFIGIYFSLKKNVAEGTYELRDGQVIKLGDFDPAKHGPFPRCHEHHGEHYDAKTDSWVQNSEIDLDSMNAEEIPVGHPQNKDWQKIVEKRLNEQDILNWKIIQPSLHTITMATLCVLIGCKHAVWMYVRPHESDEDKHTEEIPQAALQDGDAYMFPIIGSCALFGLFLLYKYMGTDLVKLLVTGYIALMCTNGIGMNIGQYVALRSGRRDLSKYSTLFTIPYLDIAVTPVDIGAYIVAIALGTQYMLTKHWIINNLMGVSFCVLGLTKIGLSTYKTGAILLLGLFLYDIFWVFGSKPVFGSNVMVTVATGVEAPIKLMFPRGTDGCGEMMFSMLGLGDIVVPGIFIGFLAKWDVKRTSMNAPSKPSKDAYLYFNVTMIAYVLSLVNTIFIMLVFHHAQPALLYIVPYTLIASFGTAVVKGEVKQLLEFKIEDTIVEDVAEDGMFEWVSALIWPTSKDEPGKEKSE